MDHDPALDALGITQGQALADADSGIWPPPRGYTTAGSIEALLRLRAARHQQVQERTHYSPALPATFPLTIATDIDGALYLHDGRTSHVITEDGVLDTLTACGIDASQPTHRSLIISDSTTVSILEKVLRTAPRNHPAVPVLDWWLQRLDFPGTTAAYLSTRLLAARWVTGSTRDDERSLDTWVDALHLHSGMDPAQHALELTRRATNATPLPGLLSCHGDDSYSWQWLMRTAAHWHSSDSRRHAALDLLGRNQAAEYYRSLMLEDPTAAAIAVRTGHLACGKTTRTGTGLRLTCPPSPVRFRASERIGMWSGEPRDADPAGGLLLQATIATVQIAADGQVLLDLSDLNPRTPPPDASTVTIRPRRADPFQQRTLRGYVARHMSTSDNWLTRAGTPTIHREVPLDVALAAIPD